MSEKKESEVKKGYEWSGWLGGAAVPAEIVRLGEWLAERKVGLICWDFDQTIMTHHTGGYMCEAKPEFLQKRLDQLSHHVAPGFRLMCRYLMQTHPTIRHAIVSFADDFSRNDPNPINASDKSVKIGGTDLIKTVLDKGFAWPRPEFHIVSFYPDVANGTHQFSSPVPKNKALHMHVAQSKADILEHNRILLVDNDINNCRAAVAQGYRTWFVAKQAGFDPSSLVILQ